MQPDQKNKLVQTIDSQLKACKEKLQNIPASLKAQGATDKEVVDQLSSFFEQAKNASKEAAENIQKKLQNMRISKPDLQKIADNIKQLLSSAKK